MTLKRHPRRVFRSRCPVQGSNVFAEVRWFSHLRERRFWPTSDQLIGSVNTSALDRHRGGGHPPTPATPPCVRVRTRRFETVTLHSSTKVGSPRDLKYALESPTVRALVRARGQGPRPLLAVLLARRGETPSFKRAARRRRGVFHCRHRAARSRNRTQRVR